MQTPCSIPLTVVGKRKRKRDEVVVKGKNVQGGFLLLMSGKVLQSLFDPLSPTVVLQEGKANASAGATSHTHRQTFQMKTELRVL